MTIQTADQIAQQTSERDGHPGSRRLHGAPGAQGHACHTLGLKSHRRGKRTDRKKATAKSDQYRSQAEHIGRSHRFGKNHQ